MSAALRPVTGHGAVPVVPAVRTVRARATRLGYQLTVRGGHAELRHSDQPVIAGPLDAINSWLVDRLAQQRRTPGPPPAPVPPQWQTLLDLYRAELHAAHRTTQTIATRMSHLTTFARTVGTPPELVTRDELTEHIGRPDRAHRTAHGIRASLRDLFEFAAAQGIRADNPATSLPPIRQARSRPRPCPDQVARDALSAEDPRIVLAITILIETGLRRAEAAQLSPADVIGEPGRYALHVTGKGGHQRIVPIAEELADRIRMMPGEFVFPAKTGGHLTPRHLGKLVARALPGRFTAHTLRHRFATRAYEATGDLRAVQELLGHASPVTTSVYVAVSDESMRRAAIAAALTDDH